VLADIDDRVPDPCAPDLSRCEWMVEELCFHNETRMAGIPVAAAHIGRHFTGNDLRRMPPLRDDEATHVRVF
jgi:hypothetical protein